MHLLLIWLQTEIFFLILMFTGWFNPRKAYSTGVATTQIYMLQQAIESVRLWLVQTHISVAIAHQYPLQLCNGYL
jgi:hypothetical protein